MVANRSSRRMGNGASSYGFQNRGASETLMMEET